MRKTIHEVFDDISNEKDLAKRADILRKNDTGPLRQLLKLNFDQYQNFDLPEGAPPFKSDPKIPIGMADTNLFVEVRRLYIFMKEKYLPRIKKEALFIQMLEGLHHTEAELLIAVKDGKLEERYKGVTRELVDTVFPFLLDKPAVPAEPTKRGKGRPRKNVVSSPT